VSGGVAVPRIEHTLQKTTRTVYFLVRGVDETVDAASARSIAAWIEGAAGVTVDRTGPSSFPGPDGSRYEWFLRLAAVDGVEISSPDSLYEAAQKRLSQLVQQQVPSPAATLEAELPMLDLGRAELSRVTGFLHQQLQRHWQLIRTVIDRRPVAGTHQSAYREAEAVISAMLEELVSRESAVEEREIKLSQRESWVRSWQEELSQRPVEGAVASLLPELGSFVPRLDLDNESVDVITYELSTETSAAYKRFLAALNDGCDVATHPCCMKHEKVKATQGKSKNWWEVRLRNSIADSYRLYYRHMPDTDQLVVRVRHKKDQDKFLSQL
jgi:hypothetical protein